MNSKLIKTTSLDNIFYGDLFIINGSGCLIFGTGKTKAGRTASDNLENNEIALDFACLTREEQNLFGHFEIPTETSIIPDPICLKVKIDFLIRMLSEEETIRIKQINNLQHLNSIIRIDLVDFISASIFNITFTIPEGTYTPFMDQNRVSIFEEITKQAEIKECLLVPWMSSHIEKGEILKNYINKI